MSVSRTRPRVPHLPTGGSRAGLRLILPLVAVLLTVLGAPAATLADHGGPHISLQPMAGPAGSVVEVSGTDWDGECGVQLWFGEPDEGIFLQVVFLFTEGTFGEQVTIPLGAELGEHDIVALGLEFGVEFCAGRSGSEARASFRVTENGELEPRFVPRKPERTIIGEGFSRTQAHLKFNQGTMVRLRDGDFVSLGEDDLTGLHDVLADYPDVLASRLFSARSEEELAEEKERLERLSGREQGDKNLYFLLTYPETTDAEALLDDLNALEIVELAYPEPLEGEDPTMHTPDFRPNQGYRLAAPGGIAADAAMTVAGGRGQNVQIIDIERYFNPDHEDLPAVTEFANGDPLASFTAPFDHGTAVLGEMFGVDNGFGVLGLADQAAAGFVTTAGGRPNAIDVATTNSSAGDVILLELQRGGPNGACSNASSPPQIGCVPEEFVQASYDAIVAAVSAGVIVVAAAGNGRQNLDSADYDDTFGTRPDSGAIIVGAGAAPGCTNPPRGRLIFSNFGSRVNLQGWGECVTTTGYGALQGAPDSDDAYTGAFSGTSSASPIVASAAAIVSSVAIAQGDADGLSSTEARALLMATGTPQDTSAAALDGNIGPLPNLAAALGLEADLVVSKSADQDPVAAGTNLTYTVSVTNDGPNVAIGVTLLDELPSEVSLVSSDPPCDEQPSGDLLCELGDLDVSASVDVEIVVAIPANLVFDAGAPVTITNTASATSTIDDPNTANNSDSLDVLVVAVADLEVVDVEVIGLPGMALIGEDIPITLRSTVRNLGPSAPIDAEVEANATPSAGASATPASDTAAVNALALDALREVDQSFTVRCEGPGVQEVVFDVEIRPANAADSDPDLSNNEGQVTAGLECIVPIAINVRPANKFNRVNVRSAGLIPVAALTTEAGEYGLPVAFDATQIVPSSVRFGAPDAVWNGTGGAAIHNGVFHVLDSFELDDKTKDKDLDMRFGFKTPQTGIAMGDTEACMMGQYEDGGSLFTFFGCDFVQTMP